MYQIFFNDLPIYDPRGQDMGLVIRDPDCHLAVGEAGSLSFTIDNDHPYAQRMTRMKGVVKVLDDGRAIYKGRIRKDPREFDLSRRIDTEGLLACLNDSIIPPFNFPDDFQNNANYVTAASSGNVIQFFLNWLLTEHNSQVGPDQQIRIGTVSVRDANNYITRSSSDYLTTMEVVKKKLVDLLGGHLLADYSGDTTVLHYYADFPYTNNQMVEFGENLLDLVDEIDASDTYTAILPIGKDNLTIEELPDGEISPGIRKLGRVIYSVEAEEATGGRITRVVKWDDVTLASNLQTKGAAELSTAGVKHIRSITVKAADLGDSKNLPRFVIGRYVRFNSKPHGFADAYPLLELNPNILNPADTEITLGAKVKASSDLAYDTQDALGWLELELNKQEETISRLPQETQQQITQAIQTSEAIILAAMTEYTKTSDLESYKEAVSAQLAILADEIGLHFTRTLEYTEAVDGDVQKVVETLEKHFDFNIDGLIIRAGDNAMTLHLDTDIISFRTNGEQFGWWDGVDFHTGNIVIDVTERAQFGNFAFVPRSNGSLSFLKVGG